MRLFKHYCFKAILLASLGFCFSNVKAQNITIIKGQLVDTSDRVILANATINLLRAKDSVLLNTVRADKEGRFQMNAKKDGQAIIMISYPQYADYIDKIELANGQELNLNKIYLNTKAHLLKEVIIRSTVSAIRIKGDTTEFKADSFHVTPNADVQELLKKMPGIQVNSKGEITAQGEKVNKVFVDGEEFFSDDPAVVTKNLRADAIDKVQVYDKKSDQATFTGIDDGIKSKTINLQLKEDKKNGYFGKAEIGSNFGQYGNQKLMANAFKGKKKLAGYFTANNTTFEGLNWDETRNYSDGGNTVTEMTDDGGISMYYSSGDGEDYNETIGLPNQQSAGAVFGNKKDNASTNNNVQYQHLLSNSNGSSYAKTILQDSSFTNYTTSKQKIDKKKYKFNTINEWGTDTTGVFKIIIKGANVLKDANSENFGQTFGESGHIINQTKRVTALNEDDKSLTSNLSFRMKFAKKGRTISITSDLNFNDKKQDGSLNADNNYYDFAGNILRNDLVDQLKKNTLNTSSINSSLTYTEPWGKKSFMIFKYGLNVAKNESERDSYNKNNGQYNDRVDSLSNHFIFNTINNSGSVNYRFVEKKYNISIGSGFGTANYKLEDLRQNSQRAISYNNFIPAFSWNYNPKQQRRLRFSYVGNTINPTLQQIQPVIDNSDPLNISIGNANLKQGFTNKLNMSASDFKVLKSRYISIDADYANTDNGISNSSTVDAFGRRVNQFVNVQGSFNYGFGGWFGMDIFKGINGGLNVRNSVSRYINYVNGVRNVNDNSSISYGVNLSHWGDGWYNFWLNFSANSNSTVSSIRPGVTTNYWVYSFNGRPEFKFKKIKTYIDINIDANIYQKTKVFANQRDVYIVSPSIRKVFTKTDAWELKLYVFDAFNQNSYVQRNISSNFISENTNNGVKRYFMFSVIYNFTKNGKPSNMGF